MATEIERKFLVADDSWRKLARSSEHFRQGYLSVDPARTVRVRVAGSKAWLTIKGESHGMARSEFEYPIPLSDAAALLEQLCHQPIIDKTRHIVPQDGLRFEVDVFHGANEGLVLAELELESADASIVLPRWIGREVTGDKRYFNAHLVRHPFRTWPDA